MTEQTLEQLSALMDGELEHNAARFLLRRCEADANLSQHWSRYHVTRACLRRQLDAAVTIDFAHAVMARIEKEVMTPSSTRWMRWASGGAIAAAVAVVALLISRPAGYPDSSLRGVTANIEPSRAIEPAVESRTPLLLTTPPVVAAASFDYGQSLSPSYDPRFASYLNRHEANGPGVHSGVAPYVLLIEPARQQTPAAAPQDKSANPP